MTAPARLTDPATSQVARPTAKRRTQVRDLVLSIHRNRPRGVTDAELCALLPHLTPGSVIKRRGELVADGLLVDSGDRRPVKRTGRAAIVWRIVP
mgnify:CR=1 FL=1